MIALIDKEMEGLEVATNAFQATATFVAFTATKRQTVARRSESRPIRLLKMKKWLSQLHSKLTEKLPEDRFEVTLEIKVTGKQDDEDAFICELEQCGLFLVKGIK